VQPIPEQVCYSSLSHSTSNHPDPDTKRFPIFFIFDSLVGILEIGGNQKFQLPTAAEISSYFVFKQCFQMAAIFNFLNNLNSILAIKLEFGTPVYCNMRNQEISSKTIIFCEISVQLSVITTDEKKKKYMRDRCQRSNLLEDLTWNDSSVFLVIKEKDTYSLLQGWKGKQLFFVHLLNKVLGKQPSIISSTLKWSRGSIKL